MSATLVAVPGPSLDSALPAALQPTGEPPAAGVLDEFGRARIHRLIAAHLNESPTLGAHVALLDTRGAWYAERALGAWPADQPDTFFGLVRHVVRTQMAGPPPAPDIEAWLHAGRPKGHCGRVWDQLLMARHPRAERQAAPVHDRSPAPTAGSLDTVLATWPAGHMAAFTLAYCSLEAVLEQRRILLPGYDH